MTEDPSMILYHTMKYLITIISYVLPMISCIGQNSNTFHNNCISLSDIQFQNKVQVLSELSTEDFLESSKLFIEKYCIDNNHLSEISSLFETDHDRIEFLYHFFSHTENTLEMTDVDFNFEDEMYQEIFISFINGLEEDMSLELSSAELEVIEIQKSDIDVEIKRNNNDSTKIVYVPEYRGRIGVDKPMSSVDYFNVQKAIQLESLSSKKVDTFIDYTKDKGISVDQLDGILSLYNYENDRMKVFNNAIDKVYDLDNLSLLKNHFVNLFHKKEIDRITNHELNKYMKDRIAMDEEIKFQHY